MLFGEKIKSLRKANNMSQEELAKKLGITRRSVLNYETKSMYPKNGALIGKMAEIFNVPADYLFSREDYDKSAGKEAETAKIIESTKALFAGGELTEEDKIAFIHQIQKIYLESGSKE